MTDARLPDRWLTDRRLLRLPDDAFRLFTMSLLWSVANKTDGVLYDDDLALVPAVDRSCGGQLVKAGLWQREADYWVITEFADTQTSRDELNALAARRRADRSRKAAERTRKARSAAMSRDASRDSHAESVRQGQARQGKDPRNVVPGKDQDQDQDQNNASATQSTTSGEAAGLTPLSSPNPGDDNGPVSAVLDDQHTPAAVHLQSPAERGNAHANANGHKRPSTIRRREAQRQHIIREISANPGITSVKLIAAVGSNRQVVFTLLNQLTDDGAVIQVRDPADQRRISYYPAAS